MTDTKCVQSTIIGWVAPKGETPSMDKTLLNALEGWTVFYTVICLLHLILPWYQYTRNPVKRQLNTRSEPDLSLFA